MGNRIQFTLPFPVPLHACFIKSKGGTGIPSKRYKAYGWNAQADIIQAGRPRISGPVSVKFLLCAPDRRKRDGDNLTKCLFDTLVNNGVIEDDNNQIVRKFSMEWVENAPACTVVVEEYAPDVVSVPMRGVVR